MFIVVGWFMLVVGMLVKVFCKFETGRILNIKVDSDN